MNDEADTQRAESNEVVGREEERLKGAGEGERWRKTGQEGGKWGEEEKRGPGLLPVPVSSLPEF